MEEKYVKPFKSWKKSARTVLKKHYVLLVIVCLVAVMYGTEFDFVNSNVQNLYNYITGQPIEFGGDTLKLDSARTRDKVLSSLANEDYEGGSALADEQLKEYEESKLDKSVTGRKSGIFAGIANDFSSGKLYLIVYEGLNTVFHSTMAASGILVFASMGFAILVWIFIKNTLSGILRRIFLEARLYDQVPVNHVLYFKLVKKWVKVSLTLLVAALLEYLWYLTVIGGVIKHYSYRMVPYIVAENPDIRPLDAVTLSRKMMDGHKWECFLLDLTFVGWYILGVLSFGIIDSVWTVPYHMATLSEYYAHLREETIEKKIEGYEYLNDKYLFEKAEEAFLRKTYNDIEEQKKFIDEHRVTLPPRRAFFAKNFGLWTGSIEEKREYDEVDNRRQQIVEDRAVIKGKIYPQRLSPLWDEKNNLIVRKIGYLRTYTFWSVVFMFFAFAFVGWSWEVGIHLVKDGVFVNRGVFHGPWLPPRSIPRTVAAYLRRRRGAHRGASCKMAQKAACGSCFHSPALRLRRVHDLMVP